MQINIKQLILEGYSYDEITEAVHANHSHLNKNLLKDPNTPHEVRKKIEQNRKILDNRIRESRHTRDEFRKEATNAGSGGYKRERDQYANYYDNNARGESQTGGKSPVFAAEYKNVRFPKMEIIPRAISSANK